jgi:hypothetical protein
MFKLPLFLSGAVMQTPISEISISEKGSMTLSTSEQIAMFPVTDKNYWLLSFRFH